MTIKFTAKCSDCFAATLHDDEGNVLVDYQGYVPSFFPGQHFGDYVVLDVELETGKILNWEPPTQQQLQEFIERHS